MPSLAYDFEYSDYLNTIRSFALKVDKEKLLSNIFYFKKYLLAKKFISLSKKIYTVNSKMIIEPHLYLVNIRYCQQESKQIKATLNTIKYKCKNLSYNHPKRDQMLKLASDILKQIDDISDIDIRKIESEEVTIMNTKGKNLINVFYAFPSLIKIHIAFIFLTGLFMFSLGMCDLFGYTLLHVKSPGIIFGILLWTQFGFYFIKPEKWNCE